jgi:hypothetical protein
MKFAGNLIYYDNTRNMTVQFKKASVTSGQMPHYDSLTNSL